MSPGWRTQWDPLSAVAATIALIMVVLYLGLIRRQGGSAAPWFVAALSVAAALSVYGTVRRAPRRARALALSGMLMTPLGLLGILSIGLPILVAAAVALIAAARADRHRSAAR